VHGVAVRPGKPVLVAHRAAGAIVWAGLPGNVLSTAASFRFFVLPLVRSLLGLDPHPHALRARLARDFPKPAGLRFFARCSLRTAPDGALEAHPDDRQASGMVSALAATDAYAVFAEELSLVPAGAMVDVVPDGEEL
jgi:molybdopterin molybdotransferase